MALAQRVDVEKGQRLVALKELEAGDLALDDFAKNACGHLGSHSLDQLRELRQETANSCIVCSG